MYEFICDYVIPGCTTKERAETAEAAREKAIEHLHEHHDMSYIDEPLLERINTVAIRSLR